MAGEHGGVAAQLAQGGLLELADALLGDAVRRAEVGQRHAAPVRAVQPVAHADDLRAACAVYWLLAAIGRLRCQNPKMRLRVLNQNPIILHGQSVPIMQHAQHAQQFARTIHQHPAKPACQSLPFMHSKILTSSDWKAQDRSSASLSYCLCLLRCLSPGHF